jgi:hypothetical protein
MKKTMKLLLFVLSLLTVLTFVSCTGGGAPNETQPPLTSAEVTKAPLLPILTKDPATTMPIPTGPSVTDPPPTPPTEEPTVTEGTPNPEEPTPPPPPTTLTPVDKGVGDEVSWDDFELN